MVADGPCIALVVAVAENGVIGSEGGLPWHISSDLKFFRKVTMGKPIVMGRKTFEAIGKPLDGRDNIVVTRDPDFAAPGVDVARSIEAALTIAREKADERGCDEISIIGGAEIYSLTLPFADRVYLTRVHAAPDGDAFFPTLAENEWQEVSRERHQAGPKDDFDYSIVVLNRLSAEDRVVASFSRDGDR